ncbi:MAG: hypothetical protein FJX76_13925 [Armatimonadetes bacterium]|nr:hypothetical protein [Armatimonadota bacterium]
MAPDRKRVLIVDLQQIYKVVRALYVPYVYGALRVHAERHAAIREGVEFLDPICVPDTVERLLARVDAPDVVGFSTYVWNERNSHRLAEAVKKQYPSATIVFGGPQIPREPSDYFERHPWLDVCVHGEGETPFTALLLQVISGAPDMEQVPGISYRRNGRQHFTRPSARISDLDLPSPFTLGYFDGFIERHRAQDYLIVASLETSRGCPYSCAFCNWGMATSSKPRYFPEERVRGDFAWVADHDITMMFIIDANFGIFPRDVGLMEYAAELKRSRGFPQCVVVSGFAKNNKDRTFEITRILQDNALDEAVTVNFSLQATSQTALEAIDRQNIPLDSYRALSDKYAENGYTLTPDLIFPLPGETLDSFKEGYADLASWSHVNRIRTYPLCILPNTPMDKPEYREKWGLSTRVEKLKLPFLEPECDEIADEFIEAVISTGLISETDAAEARVFVAVVNACEIYHLTSTLRRGLTKRFGISPRDFYDALIFWQRANNGVLASALRIMYEHFLRGTQHGEELGWCGSCVTFDGKPMMPVKALTYDALMHAEHFQSELRAIAPVSWTEQEDELLRLQCDAWNLPDGDPEHPPLHAYEHDWPDWLGDGQTLHRRAIKLQYPILDSVTRFGYFHGLDQWIGHFLSPYQPDTFCASAITLADYRDC